MLDLNAANHEQIVEAIQFWHRNNTLGPNPPAGLVINGNRLTLDYGYNNTQKGQVVYQRGQFELIEATKPNGTLQPILNYNHSGQASTTCQDYIDALKSNDIVPNQAYVSRIIILTSECCRSSLVFTAIQTLIETQVNIGQQAWAGMEFAMKNYGSTAQCVGYNIQAGQSPWTWLGTKDYLKFINSQAFTGDRQQATDQINALSNYANRRSADFNNKVAV